MDKLITLNKELIALGVSLLVILILLVDVVDSLKEQLR